VGDRVEDSRAEREHNETTQLENAFRAARRGVAIARPH
jgi:hypothetical protein